MLIKIMSVVHNVLNCINRSRRRRRKKKLLHAVVKAKNPMLRPFFIDIESN